MITVFFDVDTQNDFLLPAGALYVPGAERILPAIAQLNRFAAARGIPLVSTADAHSENDAEFTRWPPHCVLGTLGQHKPPETLVPGQIFLNKQTTNCFESPDLVLLLQRLTADRYVVYGVVTEICVRFAAMGLLATGKPVALVTDAVQSLDAAGASAWMAEFTRAGGTLTTAGQVLAGQ